MLHDGTRARNGTALRPDTGKNPDNSQPEHTRRSHGGPLQAPEFETDWRAAFRLLRSMRAHQAVELGSKEALAEHLYGHWFHAINPHRHHTYPTAAAFRLACESAFPLTEARLLHVEADALQVQPMQGSALRLPFGLAHAEPPQATLRTGEVLHARLMAQSEQGGFWHLWSRPWLATAPDRIHRYYFATLPGHEPTLAAAIARHAPQDAVWYCKFLCGPHPQGRRDPALLYLPAGAAPAWLQALIDEARSWLAEHPLRLSQRFAHGVCRAVDPGCGLSYGQYLSQALAHAALQPGALGNYARFSHALDAFGCELKRQETAL